MADAIAFDTHAPGPAGQVQQVSPLVRRVLAPNPGPFTFTGTCSYLIGQGDIALLDPGPDDPEHLGVLMKALAGDSLRAIVVTHSHRDHSPGARALQALTGAPIIGAGVHRASRPAIGDEGTRLDASADTEHRPDLELGDGMRLEGRGWTLEAIATPGHTANHLCFALAQDNALFSGDHVMAWSTTVVAPPDGSMRDYMASLALIAQRDEKVFWPGHGGPVAEPQRFVRALIQHRRQREAAILARLSAGDDQIAAIAAALYRGIRPELRKAAALSVLAHLEDLVERGEARSHGPPGEAARFQRS
jgi:glyoxylase-like metal-dependent hydrolase (beta-lactamase superfamily II)